jgi:hypothetical protein
MLIQLSEQYPPRVLRNNETTLAGRPTLDGNPCLSGPPLVGRLLIEAEYRAIFEPFIKVIFIFYIYYEYYYFFNQLINTA